MDFVTVYFGDASTVKGSESVAGACPFPEKTGIKSTVEPGGVVPFGKWTQNEIVPELPAGNGSIIVQVIFRVPGS